VHKIKDLIEIPEIRTVIQLNDLKESRLREMILHSFVVTAEVMKSLEMILTSLSGREGRGVFLKGPFGSGKSHFLSMISLLLRHQESWSMLLSQEPSLARFAKNLEGRRFLVVEVSLVAHRGTEFLEDILLREIFEEISSHLRRPFEGTDSRSETFRKIQATMKGLGFSGLVLLVDELSEFLRSKPDSHAYHEDIRFLQYLGEEASSFPLWVVASLQEWIDETGEINQDTFNKIKDRYPVRMALGRSHIEELISHRLIRHQPGAEEEIRKLFQGLRRSFPSFPVEESRFLRLYPVHPATVALLDRLRPLFSEHRGIVDFIHYRLKGDAERGIPSFLERPAEELLGPAMIFDHFLQRIREMAETQPFVERGFNYYQDEVPRLFQSADQQHVALEAVKLLILFAISPVKVRYTARHMAEMILFRVTDLEGEINYQYVRDILDRLAKESSYLTVIPGKDPLDDQFAITLKANIAAIVRRKIQQGVSEIYPGDRRLFDRLLPLAESLHLPFAGWAEQGQQKVSVLWEHTRRSGTILLRQIDEIPQNAIEALAKESKETEEDYFLIVGTGHRVSEQYEYLRQVLLPGLRQRQPGTFLFWIPARIEDEEEEWMKEMLSALLLGERQTDESHESTQEAQEFLKNFLNSGRKRLGEILTKAYFNGLLLWDDKQIELSAYGFLSQPKFLEEFIPPLLSRRFSKHHRIHPFMEALSPTVIPSLLKDFFSTGMVEVDDRSKFGLRSVLEELLKPMGLIKKRGNQYSLHVDPRTNELAEYFLSFLAKGPQPLESLYWTVRKGDYGLTRNQFELFVFALLFSGTVLAYQGQTRKGIEEISRAGLQGVTGFGKGEVLGEEMQRTLAGHPLVPDKYRKGAFTLASQEALWNEIRTRRESEIGSLRSLLERLKWASSFQALRNFPWDSLRKDIEDVLRPWEEVKTGLSPREGLEGFLSVASKEVFLSGKLERIEGIQSFFDHVERLLFAHQYVSDPRLSIPDDPDYRSLSEKRSDLLRFFDPGNVSMDKERIRRFLDGFQKFREAYVMAYTGAHGKNRSGDAFAPYEKLRRSKPYLLLSHLDQLEMVSVEHNRRSVDKTLAGVLSAECHAQVNELLQSSPICRCGHILGEEIRFTPIQEIGESVNLGIAETIEALHSSTCQEKLLPYLKGLEEVGEKQKALAVRRVLSIKAEGSQTVLSELDEALTPEAIQGINEAFQGRVVVVKRNLDDLYRALIQRKYTLPQIKKILREWLREDQISEETFVYFIGREEGESKPPNSK
jgi:energy-coupling factor transporter ATP-binding protein EcfA2